VLAVFLRRGLYVYLVRLRLTDATRMKFSGENVNLNHEWHILNTKLNLSQTAINAQIYAGDIARIIRG